jgi:hypothetical protein
MRLQFGANIVGSYKRLAYQPWHAIAEFVDNSTQSYFNNKEILDKTYTSENEILNVRIIYEDDILRIFDNAMGMSYEELEGALFLAIPPAITSGRSRYGLGMKTAAFWLGNKWSIATKKLGETEEHKVTLKLDNILQGNLDLEYEYHENMPQEQHYTLIEINEHNREFKGRTLGKIEDYLKSIYRVDIRNGILQLEWRNRTLAWEEPELLENVNGETLRKTFQFTVHNKTIHGWVGILEHGSRAKAGFSILQSDRVIKGWPEAWRPRLLYGQEQGSNDLVNQRLVGEIHLDGFEVSHTKDEILWLGDQEELVEEMLLKACNDYKQHAQEYRRGRDQGRGPSEIATNTAIDEIRRELQSPHMVDKIQFTEIPTQEDVQHVIDVLVENIINTRQVDLKVTVGNLSVNVYLEEMSPNDPYVLTEPSENEVIIIINSSHPYWSSLNSTDVATYLRHCVYDGIAEWSAKNRAGRIDPNTIKLIKDNLLRVPYQIEDDNHGLS